MIIYDNEENLNLFAFGNKQKFIDKIRKAFHINDFLELCIMTINLFKKRR